MPTAAEIEAMQNQAREEATRQGHAEGLAAGRQEGYAIGHEQGLADGRQEIDHALGLLSSWMESLSEPLKAVDEAVEQELVILVTALARQLIRRELRTDPGEIVAVVREAMAILPSHTRKISLHVHPEDLELVRGMLPSDDSGRHWTLREDPLITRGGCKLHSETASIDASVEKRLSQAIAQAFGGDRESDGATP
jgi:flagellar assembly protein FliH